MKLEKKELLARAQKVLEIAQSEEFQRRLNEAVHDAAGDWIRSTKDVRHLVLKILDEMKVNHRKIDLTFDYDPERRKLGMWARPAIAAVKEIEAAKLRAVAPGDRPPKS